MMNFGHDIEKSVNWLSSALTNSTKLSEYSKKFNSLRHHFLWSLKIPHEDPPDAFFSAMQELMILKKTKQKNGRQIFMFLRFNSFSNKHFSYDHKMSFHN